MEATISSKGTTFETVSLTYFYFLVEEEKRDLNICHAPLMGKARVFCDCNKCVAEIKEFKI